MVVLGGGGRWEEKAAEEKEEEGEMLRHYFGCAVCVYIGVEGEVSGKGK